METEFLPETMPEDFEFSLTWGCYGISSYDSKTGKLVKTTDATHPEDYIAYYELSQDYKERIYRYIRSLDPEDYPDSYNPNKNMASSPSLTLILSVTSNGMEKTIEAEDIAYTYESKNKKGQAFLSACKSIELILTGTVEWSSLPEYEFLYD